MLAERPMMVAARVDPVRCVRQRCLAAPAAESVGHPPHPTCHGKAGAASASMNSLVARLQGLSAEQRHSELVDLVCRNAATVLGRPNAGDINAGSVTFKTSASTH